MAPEPVTVHRVWGGEGSFPRMESSGLEDHTEDFGLERRLEVCHGLPTQRSTLLTSKIKRQDLHVWVKRHFQVKEAKSVTRHNKDIAMCPWYTLLLQCCCF